MPRREGSMDHAEQNMLQIAGGVIDRLGVKVTTCQLLLGEEVWERTL